MRIVRIQRHRVFFRALILGHETVFNPFNNTMYTVKPHISDRLMRHEGIHGRQARELGNWRFIAEIIRQTIRHGSWSKTALEREALWGQHTIGYLETREPYAWLRFYTEAERRRWYKK